MKNDTLRISMLTIPDFVNSIRLTDHQIKLVRWIQTNTHGVKTSDLAIELDLTIQNASNQLTKLWQKGYLNRREVNDDTGGILYVYSIANELRFIDIPQR